VFVHLPIDKEGKMISVVMITAQMEISRVPYSSGYVLVIMCHAQVLSLSMLSEPEPNWNWES
jgi:hypothetical protein